jgi:hypothetical protein
VSLVAIPADEMALAEAIAMWPSCVDWHAEVMASAVVYEALHRYVRPGTPSNDDVPRDEMLLAEGLAGGDYRGLLFAGYGSDTSAAFAGFHGECNDEGNPDAYAAGAALALALEGES